MTKNTKDRDTSSVLPQSVHRRELTRSPMFWLSVFVFAAVLGVIVATDIFPIITNDSLGYIQHSNSLGEMGFVQVGYRQIGYPVFLAGVDTVATAIRMEPLLLTVLLQRLLVLSALGFAAWIWRWRALPLIAFVVLPTLLVYTNFVLNEGLAVGLILWYGVLVAWVVRAGTDLGDSAVDDAVIHRIIGVGIMTAVVYLALVTLRSYFTLLGFGLVAALFVMHKTGQKGRNVAIAVLVTTTLLGASFILLTSNENRQEYGVFLPAVRGERAQFWMSWQETFNLNPETRGDDQLIDLYSDGDPYAVMAEIDSLPTYSDQRERYSEVIGELFDETGTSWNVERFKSFIGVFGGGQIDDVHGIVVAASASSLTTVETLIHRNVIARREGIDYIVENFNNGRTIQPVLTSALAPIRSFPYFSSVSRWLLPVATLIMLAGLSLRSTRRLSIVGLAALTSTALLLGLFLQDSVRVVLVPLLFGITIATGVLDTGWRYYRLRNNASVPSRVA